MTTQELKQYIDKVLGNNLRCLLPSYWWKRLFNQVTDRIDEVEQSTSKLIESKVEEVKMPIVESVDELEKLKLAKGRVAAVEKTGEFATVKISDCYFSLNWEEDWSKYTIVKGVEEKDNVITDNDAAVLFSASKEMVTKDALQVNKLKSGTFCYTKWTDDEMRFSSLEEVNKALSSGKYRAINYVNGSDDYFIDDYFTFYSEKPQPSLYIKGDSWERLAKESDLEGVGSGDALVFGTERYAYVSRERDEAGNITESELTDEQIAYNIETVSLLASGEKVYLSYDGTFWMKYGHDISSSKSTYFFSAVSMTLMSSNKLWGRMMAVSSDGGIDIVNTTVGGSSITVDSELSTSSTNPVQNKVITAALNNKADKTYVDNAVANVTVDTSGLATKEELNNAIATSITNILNTEV